MVPQRSLLRRLCSDHRARHEIVLPSERDPSALVLPAQRPALRGGAGGRARDGDKCEQAAENDRALARPGVLCERVARHVRVVPHGGHDQVRAVECDHARLCQSRARVGLLHGRMDAENGNDDVEDEVECDEELIEGARLAHEETVHDPVECDRDCILARR